MEIDKANVTNCERYMKVLCIILATLLPLFPYEFDIISKKQSRPSAKTKQNPANENSGGSGSGGVGVGWGRAGS